MLTVNHSGNRGNLWVIRNAFHMPYVYFQEKIGQNWQDLIQKEWLLNLPEIEEVAIYSG